MFAVDSAAKQPPFVVVSSPRDRRVDPESGIHSERAVVRVKGENVPSTFACDLMSALRRPEHKLSRGFCTQSDENGRRLTVTPMGNESDCVVVEFFEAIKKILVGLGYDRFQVRSDLPLHTGLF